MKTSLFYLFFLSFSSQKIIINIHIITFRLRRNPRHKRINMKSFNSKTDLKRNKFKISLMMREAQERFSSTFQRFLFFKLNERFRHTQNTKSSHFFIVGWSKYKVSKSRKCFDVVKKPRKKEFSFLSSLKKFVYVVIKKNVF